MKNPTNSGSVKERKPVHHCDHCRREIHIGELFFRATVDEVVIEEDFKERLGDNPLTIVWCGRCGPFRRGEMIDDLDRCWETSWDADPFAA